MEEYFEEEAEGWDAKLANPQSYLNEEEAMRRFHWFLKRTVKIGNRTKTYRLMDMGCGTGEASWLMWNRVASVTFFDRSSVMLKAVRNKYDKGIFVKGDARLSPFLSEEFDVIISRGCLMSLQDSREEALQILAEAYRTMRPHGTMIFDWCGPVNGWDKKIYRTRFMQEEMKKMATVAGFTVKAVDGSDHQQVMRMTVTK